MRQAQAEDQLGALLDAAVDAIVLIDVHGHVTRFGRAAERLFGYAEDEVVGRNVNMLMPAPYHGEHDGYLRRYLTEGAPRIIGIGREVIARRRDGTTFPIDLSVGEFHRGEHHGFVGILRDISQRKQQEAELRSRNEELRSRAEELRLIFEYAPTAITIADLNGHIISANRACLAMLGYGAGQLTSLRHTDLVHEDDRDAALALFQVLGDSGDTREQEMRLRHRDGQVLHVLFYAACARDESGAPRLIIGEIVDRSALFEAAQEVEGLRTRLTHAARLGTLGEMVSGIAHEVNQPLTAIATYASACRRMLQSGRFTPGDVVDILEKISTQAERAGQVVRGLRALARRRDGLREPLDCNVLVREVVRLAEPELRIGGKRLVLSLAPAVPTVVGDGVQVQQVILNLIRNATEAMQGQGAPGDTVEISTAAAGGDVLVAVSDNGPGLSPQVEGRVFEPFFTTKADGMGLGLSICQSIAEAHGGRLHYRRNERGGATFTLQVPAAESASNE